MIDPSTGDLLQPQGFRGYLRKMGATVSRAANRPEPWPVLRCAQHPTAKLHAKPHEAGTLVECTEGGHGPIVLLRTQDPPRAS